MIYIGVDPGKSGGIAIIAEINTGPHLSLVEAVTSMIIAGREIDLSATVDWLEYHCRDEYAVAYIEKVSAMPKQGVTSMFNFGFSTGAIHGIMAAMDIPRYLVAPQAWKKKILSHTKKDKEAAIDYCRRTYPGTSLLATDKSRKPHSGMADALCIARYALLRESYPTKYDES